MQDKVIWKEENSIEEKKNCIVDKPVVHFLHW